MHTDPKPITGTGYTAALSNSPRHQEWVEIDNNGKKIHTWVVYPQKSEKAKVVVLIHENKGLTDWVRNLADQVAAEGNIAVAPDLLSGFSEKEQKTSDFASEDAARTAIGQLKKEVVASDLAAVTAYAKKIESSNGKVVSAGFCWGGSQSFALATTSKDLSVALVFYGSAPENKNEYTNISVPVYGFYGENDERINSTLPKTTQYMSEFKKPFESVIYPGAGHAFMRLGEDKTGEVANQTARDAAWLRMKEILQKL
jgi:carboxymethylenebutenolidase